MKKRCAAGVTSRATARRRRAGARACSPDYRLRIASVVRDYGMNRRAEAPLDSRSAHST